MYSVTMAVVMMIKQFFKLCWLQFVIAQFVQMALSPRCQGVSLPLAAKHILYSVTYSMHIHYIYVQYVRIQYDTISGAF